MTMLLTSARITRVCLAHRELHSNAELIKNCTEIVNKNPRNLERLRIARKPNGYHLDKPTHSFWHKLFIEKHSRNVVAKVCHFENGPIITVSSLEWALKKWLYRPTDSSAYINIGRLLAQRCLESGICEMEVDSELSGEKSQLLIKELEKAGIVLTEPPVYKYPHYWFKDRPEKPWEIHE